jgi:hypothetical protein
MRAIYRSGVRNPSFAYAREEIHARAKVPLSGQKNPQIAEKSVIAEAR